MLSAPGGVIGMREWCWGSSAVFAQVTVWVLICRYLGSFSAEIALPCGYMMLSPMGLRG